MDDQHAIIMDTINDLYRVLMEDASRDHIDTALNRLILFTELHFSSEERLLEQYGFPGAAEHQQVHQSLLEQIRETTYRAQLSEDGELRSLLSFLRGWYLNHIQEFDQLYGKWLNERGIA